MSNKIILQTSILHYERSEMIWKIEGQNVAVFDVCMNKRNTNLLNFLKVNVILMS